MNLFFKTIILGALLISTYSCNDDDDNEKKIYPPAKETHVIDTIKADVIRANYKGFLEATQMISGLNIDAELAKIKYDVAFTVVEYQVSDPFGKKKILSGLVGYPIRPTSESKALHIASIQHGTIALESQAPSKNTFKNIDPIRDILTLVTPAHENGYVVAMPDYFGYGSDEAGQHFYEHRSSLAGATRSLIEDLPKYLKQKTITVNTDKVYLFGYSEGGFATMSALKSFSEANDSQFKNFVTVAGAGAYDKEITAPRILQQTTGDSPTFTCSYAWVLLTYNKVYKIDRKLDDLFKSEVLPSISKVANNDSVMLVQLPAEPINVFSPNFSKGLIDGTDQPFMKSLKDNNSSDFNAKGDISLIHGAADTWVPTYNTDSAYVRLQKRGVNINKIIVPGGTHATTYPFFAIESLKKL